MNLLQLAKQERDKLNRVIALLESEMTVAPAATTAAAKPVKKKQNRHQWTDAERKAMSAKQKALWAAKKKSKKA
jgi:predicted RNA methylase